MNHSLWSFILWVFVGSLLVAACLVAVVVTVSKTPEYRERVSQGVEPF